MRWSRRGPAAILDQLRANAATGAKPMGVPEVAALADAVVHALDIRRPLTKPRPIPQEAFVVTAGFFAAVRWPLSIPVGGNVRKRIDGVQLVADDLDWSHGQGSEVRGSGEGPAAGAHRTPRRTGRADRAWCRPGLRAALKTSPSMIPDLPGL